MSTKSSTSILFPHIDAVTVEKANSIASLIKKARRYSNGGVPLTQDEQEQLDIWLAEYDHNITLYTHLTDSEYLNMLGSIDLKMEKREVRKLCRSRNPTRPTRVWRLLKAWATKLNFRFSMRK